MKKAAVLIALLAIALCQDLVIDSWTGYYNHGTQYSKIYENIFSHTTDFSFYGWFKISPHLPRQYTSTIFQFTSNIDGFSSIQKDGDRVLALQLKENDLEVSTYACDQPYVRNLTPFEHEEIDKWTFFYIRFGQYKNDPVAYASYFQFQSGPVYHEINSNQINGLYHEKSDNYKIYVGQAGAYRFFPGTIFRLTIHVGNEGIRPLGTIGQLMTLHNPLNKCPILYTECNYTGNTITLCGTQKFDTTSIKSIYIPEGGYVTLYHGKKKAYYEMSVDCMEKPSFSLFIQHSTFVSPYWKNHKSLKNNKLRKH